jgi:Fur family transcriptional regulator, peroxide stress response regulator
MSDVVDVERLRGALRTSGRPVTPQRLQIWEALHTVRTQHPTAAELHRLVPELPLATVYNTLELFSELGLLLPLTLDGVVRYDVDTTPHVNVICTGCGTVTDVGLALPPALRDWVQHESGYTLSYPRVDWYGVCPHCTKARE